jgi:SAM-dependent methyltransferase
VVAKLSSAIKNMNQSEELPYPPTNMRMLVGPVETSYFDNSTGAPVFPTIPTENYESVFDFGCGCGRLARQLLQQRSRPLRYLGIDLHLGMITWCKQNLTPRGPNFHFLHHDVYSLGFNPGRNKPSSLPLPVADRSFKLVLAWSVFTHLLEEQVVYYLGEIARILDPGGIFVSTWFLFDKKYFPMMQEFQNALFINSTDPTNAVILDFNWLAQMVKQRGLKIIEIEPPAIRGFQWRLHMASTANSRSAITFPTDVAPFGVNRPPVPNFDPAVVGLSK